MMLEHLGKQEISQKSEEQWDEVLKDGTILTPDLGGCAGTKHIQRQLSNACKFLAV